MLSQTGPLVSPQVQQAVKDPRRLNTLKSLALMDTPTEEMFDRLTRLATRLIGVPVSLISLVDGDRQWFKSAVGLPEPWATARQTALSHSFCQHVVASQSPLVVSDARKVDFLKDNLAIPDLNVIGYLGMPLTTSDGQTLGSFCVIDSQPREWTEDEITILTDLMAITMSMIEMRSQVIILNEMNEGRLRSAMLQLTKVESKRKEEAAAYASVLKQVADMVDSQRAHSDIMRFLSEHTTN